MLVRLALLLVAASLGSTGLPISDTKAFVVSEVDGVGKYFYNNVAANWTEALKQCAVLGGHMLVINSAEEYAGALTLMETFLATSVHLGFHDKFTEGVYVTLDDDRVAKGESYWRPGSPGNGNANKNCGGLTVTGIADIDCLTEQTSICEIRQWSEYESLEAPVSRYNYHGEKRTWADAWEVCNTEGGHLVVVDTEEEAMAIARKYRSDMWVGAHRVHDAGFVTVINRPLEGSYAEWDVNYPFGDARTHPYAALDWSTGSDGNASPSLITFTATGQLPFLCETHRTS